MKHKSLYWKRILAAGLSAFLLCGCRGHSSPITSTSAFSSETTDSQNTAQDKHSESQKYPAWYFSYQNDNLYCYLTDNIISDNPTLYPFSCQQFPNNRVDITPTSDGEWLYMYGVDPNQVYEMNGDIIDQRCLYRIRTKDLSHDADQNSRNLQKIELDINIASDFTDIEKLPDGSVLLFISGSFNNTYFDSTHAIYHIDDDGAKLLTQNYFSYEKLDENTIFYEDSYSVYGWIKYNSMNTDLEVSEVKVENGNDIFGQDNQYLYYRCDDTYAEQVIVHRVDCDGNDEEIAQISYNTENKEDIEDAIRIEYDSNDSFFHVYNGNIYVALCHNVLSFYASDSYLNRYFNLYKITSDGTVETYTKRIRYPFYVDGVCFYGKYQDPEDKIYYTLEDGTEMEVENITGRLHEACGTEDGKTVAFRAENEKNTLYTAIMENKGIKDVTPIEDANYSTYSFTVVGNRIYYAKMDGDLYCLENGETTLVARDCYDGCKAFLENDGCIIVIDPYEICSFYKNGERLGETNEDSYYSLYDYIGNNVVVEYELYSDKASLLMLNSEGYELINELDIRSSVEVITDYTHIEVF